MGSSDSTPDRMERRLEAPPLVVGTHTIRLVAGVTGWQATPTSTSGTTEAVLVRVTPLEITVEDEDGEYRVPMADPMREPILGIVKAGAFVGVVCLLVMLAARSVARRKLAFRK